MSEGTTELTYEALMALTGLEGTPDSDALHHIGHLIDLSGDSLRKDGLKRALDWCTALEKRTLSAEHCVLLEYFRANAWANLEIVRRQDRATAWAWEQPELQQQVLHLRRAEHHDGFASTHALRQCQILTNLANQLNTVGRFADAQAYWRKACAAIHDSEWR